MSNSETKTKNYRDLSVEDQKRLIKELQWELEQIPIVVSISIMTDEDLNKLYDQCVADYGTSQLKYMEDAVKNYVDSRFK